MFNFFYPYMFKLDFFLDFIFNRNKMFFWLLQNLFLYIPTIGFRINIKENFEVFTLLIVPLLLFHNFVKIFNLRAG